MTSVSDLTMPPKKKKPKVNRADKEKPLLTVQGVLRLENSFKKATHDDAEILRYRRDDDGEVEEMKLIPKDRSAKGS